MNKLVLKRLARIAFVLTHAGFDYLVDELNLKVHLPLWSRLRRRQHPVNDNFPFRARKILEDLGGAFIKLGQLLSLRPDLVPNDFCEEFKRLQDRVKPAPYYKIKDIIKTELKGPPSNFFKDIEHTPLGSASIGQAHFARLRDGSDVVIKVRRPGVEKLFEADIGIMYMLARRIEKKFSKYNFSPLKIVQEFDRYSKEELDYTVEARHIEIFYENFKGSKNIKIPKVYSKYTTSRVLALEYLEGEKLSELLASNKKFDRVGVALAIFDLAIRQVFQTNIFHADLHPGNILIINKNKIGLVDFGITGTLPNHVKEQGIRLYLALIDEDVAQIYEALLAVADISKDTDLTKFRMELNSLVRGWNASFKHERVTNLLMHILDLCIRHKIILPANLLVLGKALLTVEGTCLTLYPNFNFVEESKPYVVSLIKGELRTDFSVRNLVKKSFALKDLIEKLPTKALSALNTIERGTFYLDIEDKEIKKLGRDLSLSGDRVSLALVAASFIVAGALIFQINPAPTYFGYSIFAVLAFVLASVLILSLLLSFFKKD